MKRPVFVLFAAMALAPFAAEAATPVKKPSKNPALAQTWVANAKTYEGKKVTTSVIEYSDLGSVSSDAPYAIVPIVTGTPGGEAGDEIAAVVPTARLRSFVESLGSKKVGKGGSFGAKVQYASVTGTFVTLGGEPALVIGEVSDAVKAIKPSALLAEQRAAGATSGEKPAEEPAAPAGKKEKKKGK